MKKQLTITSILFFAMITMAIAQTEKGKFYVGGASNLDFLAESSDNNRYNKLKLDLETNTGYFLTDNFLVSLGLLYSLDDDVQSYGAGLKVRGYLNNFFAGMGYSLQKKAAIYEDYFLGRKIKSTNTGGYVLVEGGYALFLNNHFALEPTLGYSKGTGDFHDGLGFSLKGGGLSFKLGLSAYF